MTTVSIRSLVRETAVYGISSVIARSMGLILLPVLTNPLLPEEFGHLKLTYTLVAFLQLFFIFGMGNSLVRHLIGASRKAEMFSTHFWPLLAVSTLGAAAVYLGADFIAGGSFAEPLPDDPQLVVTDSTYTYGQFAVEASHRTSGEASISGVFDDIYFILPPGETYVVNPEGTGDFPTIQAAIAGVQHGDVIELTDGTFTGDGNRDMDYLGKAITIRSQSGNPQACIIDCAGSRGDPHRGFSFVSDEGPESVLEGVTIANGYLPPPGWGAGVEGGGSSTPLLNGICSDNWAYEGGGATFTSASHATFVGCLFSGNSATAGGGVAVASGSSATLTDCTFSGNSAVAFGGGLSFVWSLGTVVGCTFHGNGAPEGSGVHSGYGSALEVQNCIVAFSTQGPGVGCGSFVIPTLTCCDIYGNAGGDWVGDIADQYGVNGNICEDPLFCDPENGDFTITSDSPCAPDYNPECGLIGAWPAECCVGDLDGDRDTDQADLGVLLADWGCDDPVNGCAGDLNGDDKTDQADLGILLADWGCGT